MCLGDYVSEGLSVVGIIWQGRTVGVLNVGGLSVALPNKAYQMIEIINLNFRSFERITFLMLYKSMVRSHLE